MKLRIHNLDDHSDTEGYHVSLAEVIEKRKYTVDFPYNDYRIGKRTKICEPNRSLIIKMIDGIPTCRCFHAVWKLQPNFVAYICEGKSIPSKPFLTFRAVDIIKEY